MSYPTRQGSAPCFLILLALLPSWAGAVGVWTEAHSPATDNIIYSVDYVDRTDAWAVGGNGTILRLVDGNWQNFTSGTDQNLLGVYARNKSDVWAVGNNGTILHFDGRAWRPDPASQIITPLPLRAVAFFSGDIGFAVGGRFAEGLAPAKGIVLRYQGGNWILATETTEPLFDVVFVGEEKAHICGGNRTLLRYDGSDFFSVASPVVDGGTWRAMAFPFDQQGWVVGDGGKIAKFSVNAWAEQLSPTDSDLHAFDVLNESLLGLAAGENGVRLTFLGGGFSLEPPGEWTLAHSELFGAAMANELEGVAVGGTEYQGELEPEREARIFMVRHETNEQDLENVRVFPNPFNPRKERKITFDKLPQGVRIIEVTTLLGEVIAGWSQESGYQGVGYQELTGVAEWDGRLSNGDLAASGPYVLRIETSAGDGLKAVFLLRRL